MLICELLAIPVDVMYSTIRHHSNYSWGAGPVLRYQHTISLTSTTRSTICSLVGPKEGPGSTILCRLCINCSVSECVFVDGGGGPPTGRFHNNLWKDDSALFSRFLFFNSRPPSSATRNKYEISLQPAVIFNRLGYKLWFMMVSALHI
jgi:hypothetical protein